MGRQKYIETPEKLWKYFTSYRDKLKSEPIFIVEQKKGNAIIPKGATTAQIKAIAKATVELPVQRPLTMEGFQNWLDDNDIITDVTDYFENKDKRYQDYVRICSRIKRTIRQDQIEGGMAGIYNPSITQRLNGLKENIEETGTKEVTVKVVRERKAPPSDE